MLCRTITDAPARTEQHSDVSCDIREPKENPTSSPEDITSPASRLPFELVHEILCYATVDEDAMDVFAPHWRLGHVCVFWRLVSLACPEMWSTLEVLFHMFDDPDYEPAAFVDRLRTVLSRSGTHPLNVTLYVGERVSEYYEAQVRRLLLAESYRVIWLDFAVWIPRRAFLGQLETSLSNLQSFGCTIWRFHTVSSLALNVKYCPRLSEFRWVGGDATPTKIVPWEQITSFIVSSFDEEAVSILPDLLARCTSLRKITSVWKETPNDYESFWSPFRTQLSCCAKSLDTDLAGLFSVLVLPQLSELVIRRSLMPDFQYDGWYTTLDYHNSTANYNITTGRRYLFHYDNFYEPRKENDRCLLASFERFIHYSSHATTVTSLSLVKIRLDRPNHHALLLALLCSMVNLAVLDLDLDLQTSSPLFMPYDHVVTWLRQPGCLPLPSLSSFSYTMRIRRPTVEPQKPYFGFVTKRAGDRTLTKFVDAAYSRLSHPESQLKVLRLDIAKLHLYASLSSAITGGQKEGVHSRLNAGDAERLGLLRDSGVNLRVRVHEEATDTRTNVDCNLFNVQWPLRHT